jgi:hypothetical protein
MPPTALNTNKAVHQVHANISSVILIRINLTRHNHHPHQKHRANNPKRKLGLPILAYIPLLQPRQRIAIRPLIRTVEHIRVALVIDVRAGEQLDRGPDYAGDEEYQQDEGEQHHGAREQAALRDEDDFDDDEEDGQGADCDAVGHDPGSYVSIRQRWVGMCVAYHGVPRPMALWICMNCAFTPRIKLEVASITMVHMLSWRSGQ